MSERWRKLLASDENPTDTDLLDFLQWLTDEGSYSGRVVLRDSSTGRGWRLHEIDSGKGHVDVRDAITQYIVNRFTRDAEDAPEGA